MIKPAIIPRSLQDLEESLAKVSFASDVQIDVVDGQFVEPISWPYDPKGEVLDAREILLPFAFEVDLMVAEPVAVAESWLKSGAKGLIFHLESVGDIRAVLELKQQYEFELGLSILNDTLLESLYPYLDQIDFVQLMGIKEIGSQGQPFDERVLERIVTLWTLYPDTPISVDGGVNEKTISNLKTAGASRFVVGSALLSSDDPEAKYAELLKIISV